MYYVLFRKTDNLTPDEQHAARRGGIWLHTGIAADTKTEAKEEIKRLRKSGRGFTGDGCKLKIAEVE